MSAGAQPVAEVDRSFFPGLNTQSVTLWRQWLKFYEGDFSSYDYNVRVGQGIQPPPATAKTCER